MSGTSQIDFSSLTDDQIRVKAAEALGWEPFGSGQYGRLWKMHDDEKRVPTLRTLRELPDPLHDLNDTEALAAAKCDAFEVKTSVHYGCSARVFHVGRGYSEWKWAETIKRALTMAVMQAITAQPAPDPPPERESDP